MFRLKAIDAPKKRAAGPPNDGQKEVLQTSLEPPTQAPARAQTIHHHHPLCTVIYEKKGTHGKVDLNDQQSKTGEIPQKQMESECVETQRATRNAKKRRLVDSGVLYLDRSAVNLRVKARGVKKNMGVCHQGVGLTSRIWLLQ